MKARKQKDSTDLILERWHKRWSRVNLSAQEKAIRTSVERGEWRSDPLFTVANAARELGLSVHTVRNWVANRRISHVRLGRVIRIKASEIRRLIDQNTVQAKDTKRTTH